MNKTHLSRLLPAIALGIFTATSHGGILDITLTNNGFVSPLKPGYSLFEAVNFQGSTVETRSGITFRNEDMRDGVDNGGGLSTVARINGAGTLQQDTLLPNTDGLFFSEVWVQGGQGLLLTLNGLNPANTYYFEVYHGEPRSCCPGTFASDTFIDGATSYPIPSYQLGNGIVDNSPGDRWTISATVTGATSFQYRMPNGAGRGASIDGYQLQSIPEPAAVSMLLAGGLVALRRRRQTS